MSGKAVERRPPGTLLHGIVTFEELCAADAEHDVPLAVDDGRNIVRTVRGSSVHDRRGDLLRRLQAQLDAERGQQ